MYIRPCPPTASTEDQSGCLPHGLKSRESLIIFRKYDVLKCVYWINFNNFKKVCLQFPDDLLSDSVSICSLIEERIKLKVFVLADTSYGSCCVDYIAAKHIDADAIIHFGESCLSSTHEIPTLYVFPKQYLDVQASCDTIRYFAKEVQSTIIVLYDVLYDHCADELTINLLPLRSKVRVSRLAVPQQNKDSLMVSPTDIIITKFGRYYSLPCFENDTSVIYVYLTPNYKRKNFENFVLNSQNLTFYRYCGEKPGYLEKGELTNAVKSRLYDISRVQEAKRIGILVSTLSTDRYLEAIERIKALCRLWNKLSYIFSFGKISPEKLANFPEISVFVLIGCPEAAVIDRKSFYQPIVGMLEVEIALNKNHVSWQTIINDYREFLAGGSQYKKIDEEEIKKLTAQTDVSLLNNAVIGASQPNDSICITTGPNADESAANVPPTASAPTAFEPAPVSDVSESRISESAGCESKSDARVPSASEPCHSGGSATNEFGSSSGTSCHCPPPVSSESLCVRKSETGNDHNEDDGAVATRDDLTVTEFTARLASFPRTWEGLELNAGNTPVEKAAKGRTGTPSSGYVHPSSTDRT